MFCIGQSAFKPGHLQDEQAVDLPFVESNRDELVIAPDKKLSGWGVDPAVQHQELTGLERFKERRIAGFVANIFLADEDFVWPDETLTAHVFIANAGLFRRLI